VILVKGNVSVSGELTESGANTESVLELGGSSSSTINLVSNAISNDISLKVNKLGGIVLALSDVNLPSSLNSKLIFNSGCINTKIYNKMVYVANPSSFSVLNGSANSHIVGMLKRKTDQIFASYDFPVSNNETQWAKATIVPNAADVTDWTVEFIAPNSSANSGLVPGVIDVVSNYYWNISKSGLSNIANLSLYYNGLSNSTVAIPNQLKVLRRNNIVWQNLGGSLLTGGVENNLGTSGGAAPLDPISDFGQFALGGVINTLPVSLNYFQGKKNGSGNELSWKVNCTGVEGLSFSLERSSDGLMFTEIHQQYASAVACQDAFSFNDLSSKSSRNYYRLFMKDSDGNTQYSQVVLLENNTPKGIVNVYPNPVFIENCRVELMAEKRGRGRISLVSLMGVKVMQQDFVLMQGKNIITLPVQKLSSGVYNVMFTDDEGYTTFAPLVIE
jgi:hypothetical protein